MHKSDKIYRVEATCMTVSKDEGKKTFVIQERIYAKSVKETLKIFKRRFLKHEYLKHYRIKLEKDAYLTVEVHQESGNKWKLCADPEDKNSLIYRPHRGEGIYCFWRKHKGKWRAK